MNGSTGRGAATGEGAGDAAADDRAVAAVLAAAGVIDGRVVGVDALGTHVESASRGRLVVSAPFTPDESLAVRVRSVGPAPPVLPRRPPVLVAELPDGPVALRPPGGLTALARAAGPRLRPTALLRLLVSQATPDGLPTLVEEGTPVAALLGDGHPATLDLPAAPVVEDLPGGGWAARFATITFTTTSGGGTAVEVHDWQARLASDGDLSWSRTLRSR